MVSVLTNALAKLGISQASWATQRFDHRIALFRIAFGGVMTYYFGDLCFSGKGQHFYVDTIYLLRYPSFEWIPVMPDHLMMPWLYFGLTCSILFTAGLWYRLSSALSAFAFTYTHLLDISQWNNHYYFYAMVAIVMALGNGGNLLSVDSLIFKGRQKPNYGWELWTLRFITGVVFFYGGVSKLSNPDWLHGLSVSAIYEHNFERLGLRFSELSFSIISWSISVFGLLFDLLVPFLLISKNPRIRILAFAFYIPFNLANAFLLRIGSFPYALLGAIFIYLHPKWLQKIGLNLRDPELGTFQFRHRVILWSFVCFQLLFPLRHWLIEGNMFWTNEGKLYGWFMMSGTLEVTCTEFYLIEHNADGEPISNSTIQLSDFLTKRQRRSLGHWPMVVPGFAKFIRSEAELAGMQNVKVYADIFVSRNGKEKRHIISPKVDLASLEVSRFKHNDWILLYAREGF